MEKPGESVSNYPEEKLRHCNRCNVSLEEVKTASFAMKQKYTGTSHSCEKKFH